MIDDVIDQETANKEFERFVTAMDLDVEESTMDVEDLTAFTRQKRRLLKSISNGSLIINESGEAVYTPQRSQFDTPLTFHEKDGAALMASDGKKKNHNMAQTMAMIGTMTKTHPGQLSKLKGSDLTVCMALYLLLMD